MTSAGSGQPHPRARAVVVARHAKLWLVPTVLSCLVALFLGLLYMGGIVNPDGSPHHLLIALVDNGQGPPLRDGNRPRGAAEPGRRLGAPKGHPSALLDQPHEQSSDRPYGQ